MRLSPPIPDCGIHFLERDWFAGIVDDAFEGADGPLFRDEFNPVFFKDNEVNPIAGIQPKPIADGDGNCNLPFR